MSHPLERDLAAVARISAVPTLLRVIAESTGMGYTLVARVTEEHWLACAVHDDISFGLRVGEELDVATTLCKEVRDTREPIVIDHASVEPAYSGHPTPKLYGFESYIAVPVFRGNGAYFGNVCALNREPRPLRSSNALAMMKLFAELISLQLHAEEEHQRNTEALNEERQLAELREQFIAVLGHDLRNPLSAIATGAEVLQHVDALERVPGVATRIRRSAQRMQGLIDDVLDFARGRLGGGLPLQLTAESELISQFRHVVDEAASQHPGRSIRFEVEGSGTVLCDRSRLEQVLSNLVANALQHGSASEPVEVRVRYLPDTLELSVRNRGEPIAAPVLDSMFQPFRRALPDTRDGLGLGLYIVAEVAKAHGGHTQVRSTVSEGTVLTVTIPRR